MKLYTLEFCPKCELAIKVLNDRGYKFDIIQNADSEETLSLGIKEAPCLLHKGHKYGLKEILKICRGEGQFE